MYLLYLTHSPFGFVRRPSAYWDEYMRAPRIRKGRVCIRPEISRTKTFGKSGTSNGEFFNKFLETIELNDENIDFQNLSFDYLQIDTYNNNLLKGISTLSIYI